MDTREQPIDDGSGAPLGFEEERGAAEGAAAAEREKHAVALHSLLAAVVLTGTKLAVGIATGSLGILAEAAHSGLDLVATGLTFWAIRMSSRPPDSRHTYGHGKFENLSALAETLLLLVTCVWIIVEAVARLQHASPVRASVWAFLVVLGSIAVDMWRSRALKRAAVAHNSQALEADALHFATDIWSSMVVLLGLVGVVLAEKWQIPWLLKADPVAALGVALIVLMVSLRMGKKSVDDLLDAVPEGLVGAVAGAAKVDGVRAVRRVRVRKSGPEAFADIHIAVDPLEGIGRAHEIADAAEAAARQVLNGGDVTVHVEPDSVAGAPVATVVHQLALKLGFTPHDVRVYAHGDEHVVELHLEMDGDLTLGQAHDRASRFENALREALPSLRRVITHIEPSGSRTRSVRACREDTEPVLRVLEDLRAEIGLEGDPYGVEVYRVGNTLSVGLCFALAHDTPLETAHDMSTRIEQFLRSRLPEIGRVIVHAEPLAGSTAGGPGGPVSSGGEPRPVAPEVHRQLEKDDDRDPRGGAVTGHADHPPKEEAT